MSKKHWQVVISCEHASNAVPDAYRSLFARDDDILTSHRGWDAGAAHFAQVLSEATGQPLYCGSWSRLLIDLNRSPSHPGRFSEFSRTLNKTHRQKLHTEIYLPFRNEVFEKISEFIATGGPVLHIAVHSFTPVLNGNTRNANVGLLYDPSRPNELALAKQWQALLASKEPTLRVRRNYPYRGIDDGHCTALRRQFTDAQYAGFELELNQALLVNGTLPAEISTSLQQSVLALL